MEQQQVFAEAGPARMINGQETYSVFVDEVCAHRFLGNESHQGMDGSNNQTDQTSTLFSVSISFGADVCMYIYLVPCMCVCVC